MIFNPKAGKNARSKKKYILKNLDKISHQYESVEFYETTGPFDAFNRAKEFKIDDYAALVAIGGDGTIHETVNGMMMREDGKRIPLGFLPNGSGDNFVGNLGLDSGDIKTALDFISKGQSIKIDCIRAMLDYSSPEELRAAKDLERSLKIENHMRYSLTNSSLCLSATVARKAKWLMPYIGGAAYSVQALKELMNPQPVCYDIEVDAASLNGSNESSMVQWK